jgi:tetratricopeptide (TPR) repeat protein
MTEGLSLNMKFRFFSKCHRVWYWVFLLAVFPAILTGGTALAGPSEIDKRYHQARNLIEFEQIAEQTQKTVDKEPNQFELQWRLARSHYSIAKHSESEDKKNNHYNLCIDRSSRALKMNPNSAISYFFRALCRGKQGEMNGIWASLGVIGPFEEDMKKAMEFDPSIQNGGPFRALGKLYMELPFFLGGNMDQSVYYLEQAVRLGPDYAENHLGLAQAYYAKNNLISARKTLLTLIRLTDNIVNDKDLLKIRKEGQELINKLTPAE